MGAADHVQASDVFFIIAQAHPQCNEDLCLDNFWKTKLNKVIRPKLRASAFLKKSGRQTDKQLFFFKKTFEMVIYFSKSFFTAIQRH